MMALKRKKVENKPLYAVDYERDVEFREHDWKVSVSTECVLENGKPAMVVYGEYGTMARIFFPLWSNKKTPLFQNGSIDDFKVNLASIGKIVKIRMEISPDSPNLLPEWKIREVKLKNLISKEFLKFKFNTWLSRKKDSRELMYELPAVRPGQSVLPVLNYEVVTYTSADPGADTEANVYITLFGGLGDTGKRLLHHSGDNELFQPGQKDVFRIKAVSVGSVKRVVLSCDGEGPGEGWKCDKVIIKEHVKAQREFYFPCKKWLDSSIGDGRLERYLRVKRRRYKEDRDGRDNFFHRLTGNKPGGIRVIVSEDEDSDPGFYKRYIRDNSRTIKAQYIPEEASSDENATDFFPQSQNLENSKTRTRKQNQSKNENSTDELFQYPWESETNKRHIKEAMKLQMQRKNSKANNPDIDVSDMIKRIQNNSQSKEDGNKGSDIEMPSDDYQSTDEENARSVYSDPTGTKYLKDRKRNHKKRKSKEIQKNKSEEPDKEQVKALYIGSKDKKMKNSTENLRSNSTSRSSGIQLKTGRSSRNDNIQPSKSKYEVKQKRDFNKYYPKTKRSGFPWDQSNDHKLPLLRETDPERSAKLENRTALVKPTQREDLNQSAVNKNIGNKDSTFVKRERKPVFFDTHFPSRIELRILARRARLQKQNQKNEENIALPVISKHKLKPFFGDGYIEARIRARKERQRRKEEYNNMLSRKPDNYKKIYNGPINAENRIRRKQEKLHQKRKEAEKLKEQQRREQKPKIPVFLPPIEKPKPASYNEKFAAKRESAVEPSTDLTTDRKSKDRSSPQPISNEDSDIWNYFASVIDNLKSIEAKQQVSELHLAEV